MISFDNVSLQRGNKLLLTEANCIIHSKEKIGLVGRNGSGKSSLFQLLLQIFEPTQGSIHYPKQLTIGHLAQETPALSQSAQDYVLDGDKYFRKLEQAITIETDPKKLGILQEQFEAIDGYRKHSQACQLLHGLGFSITDFNRSVKDFSGGWRMRLNLAQCLMNPAELLLLDEPTNHLDIDAILFLERFLKKFSGTLIIISHDRSFLNGLCSTILQIEHKKINRYQGNYDDFERLRAEKLLLQQKLYEKQQKHIDHMMKFVERFKAKASKAKQAQSRLKAVEKIERIAIAHSDSPIQFSFKPAKPCSSPMLSVENAEIGYSIDNPLIKNINFSIQYGERVALLGANGRGKSTFLKMLASKIQPLKGCLYKAPHNLNLAFYEQHQLEQLSLEKSPLAHMQSNYPNESEQSIRNYLGQFDFNGDQVINPIAPLSGGEKARLVLALLLFKAPNLLLLDEPTNHLDLDMRAALEMALQSYEGALVIISHDRNLLSSTIDKFYLVAEQKLSIFDGDLDDYENYLIKSEKQKTASTLASTNVTNKRPPKKLINRLKKIETELVRLSDIQKNIELQLSLDTTYENQDLLQEWLDKQQTTQTEIERFENEWMDLQDQLEIEKNK